MHAVHGLVQRLDLHPWRSTQASGKLGSTGMKEVLAVMAGHYLTSMLLSLVAYKAKENVCFPHSKWGFSGEFISGHKGWQHQGPGWVIV